MTDIVYLASGAGLRFGSNKLLHLVDGQPLYLHGLITLARVTETRRDCRLTVVSRYPEIRAQAEELGLRAVDSPESELGISHTIRSGIRSLPGDGDFLLFAVADQPWLTADSVNRLLDLARPGTACACLSCQGQGGNPALFSAALIPELLALEGDTGGRAVLARHSCVRIPAGAKELRDIDTRQDG